jgi:2,4-dienoyl-CoA reductase-like NADH-dependent reductase (Old Yellow Enzyme family)
VVPVKERADVAIRTAHLLRIHSYTDIAINAMWTNSPRVDVMLGMVVGSLRGDSPANADDELLAQLRDLVGEGRAYMADGDPPAAMARLRVAQDLIALYLIRLGDG